MGLWSGKLKHRMATAGGYSTVDLLNLTALIPDRYLNSANHSGALLQTPIEISSLVLRNTQLGKIERTKKATVLGRSAETSAWICRYLEQLPPTLFVTELLARSAVQMSKHYIVQCRLGFLTDRQLTKLQVSKQTLLNELSH